MNNRFVDIIPILTAGGWYPGREVELPPLPQDYSIFPMAIKVLKEFGGLHFGAVGKGKECATSDIRYNPLEASRLSCHTGLNAPNGLKIYPLGEIHNGHAYIYIDEEGGVYLFFDELDFYANSHDSAIRQLLLGENSNNP